MLAAFMDGGNDSFPEPCTNQTTILPNPSIQKNASGQDKEREERERQGAKALRLRGTDGRGRGDWLASLLFSSFNARVEAAKSCRILWTA